MAKLVILNSHTATPAFVDSLLERGSTLKVDVLRLLPDPEVFKHYTHDKVDTIVALSFDRESAAFIEALAEGIAETIDRPIPVYFDNADQPVETNLIKPGDYVMVPITCDQVAIYQLPERLQDTKLLSAVYSSKITPKGAEESFTYEYTTHDGIPGWKIKTDSGYEITGVWDELFLRRNLKLDPMNLISDYFAIGVAARVTMVDNALLESVFNKLKEYGIEFPNS